MKNKIIALDIEKLAVKIAEIGLSGNTRESVKSSTLSVQAADDSGALVNVRNLVREVCEAIKESGMTAKSIRLCSPFLGGGVTLISEEKIPKSLAEMLQSNPFEAGGNRQKKPVGTLQKDGKTVEYFIESSADEFLMAELAREFAAHGFALKRIEHTQTALLNLTALAPYTYDSPAKLIIDISDKVTAVITERDVPVEIRRWNVDLRDLERQITEFTSRDAAVLHLKNPLIILSGAELTGEKFKSARRNLENAGFSVADVGVSADFAACLGLALKSRSGILSSHARCFLPPGFKPKAAQFLKIAAGIALAASTALCAFDGIKIIRANTAFKEIPALQSQIEAAESRAFALTENLEILEKSESKLTKLLDFTQKYDKSDIFIASMDTENLLPQIEVESEIETLETDKKTDNRKLIVRGYALSGSAALDFYDALQAADFAPKMNGLQTEELPSGEAVTIFELEMIL